MRRAIAACILLALTACAPPPVSVPTLTSAPSPTPFPSPTQTATPVPPSNLIIHWPEQVSALQPVQVQVELLPPPGVSVTATIRALVLDPRGQTFRPLCDLSPREGNQYAAAEPLLLPLEPEAGDWRLVVYVHSTLPVEGERTVIFRPAPIPFRDLSAALPAGVDVHVPEEFTETASQGDPVAGMRVWRYAGGELSLWWAPGPVEQLTFDAATVMLETTYEPGAAPQVTSHEETDWEGRAALLFREDWPADGPGEALVVQGPDYHLYVLRLRAVGAEAIPPLFRRIGATFTLGAE